MRKLGRTGPSEVHQHVCETSDMMSDVWVGMAVGMGWQTHVRCVDQVRSRRRRQHRLKLNHLPALQVGRM